MLTDIFAFRYESTKLFPDFRDADRRLLVQAFQILDADLMPFYDYKGNERSGAKAEWQSVHDKLCRELGVNELSARAYSYPAKGLGGQSYQHSGIRPWNTVCKNYVCKSFNEELDADEFIKRRLSFVELAFRECEERTQQALEKIDRQLAHPGLSKLTDVTGSISDRSGGIRLPGNRTTSLEYSRRYTEEKFRNAVGELNERLRRARYPLHYHNGFIQISKDKNIQAEVEEPFWQLTKDAKWGNVDHDMKESVDLRDNGGRDPAWYAAKALESTIKVVSNEKGWTTGAEKGAHNYVDNLSSKRANGFIEKWEARVLKEFFSSVRNPFGHGAGSDEMPSPSDQQTNWAIEFCMSWTKSLIQRM